MASVSSRPRGKIVISLERHIILQAYYYFKKEEEAGGPRLKINAVLKKTSEATGYSYNVIRVDLGVIRRIIHNRLYLKNESPTLKKIHEILVEQMDFPYERENLCLFK